MIYYLVCWSHLFGSHDKVDLRPVILDRRLIKVIRCNLHTGVAFNIMQDAQCGGRIVEAEPDVAIAVGAGHVLEADAF